jgi:hypothetical protein
MATITINGNSFDPLTQQTELKEFGLDSAEASESVRWSERLLTALM